MGALSSQPTIFFLIHIFILYFKVYFERSSSLLDPTLLYQDD